MTTTPTDAFGNTKSKSSTRALKLTTKQSISLIPQPDGPVANLEIATGMSDYLHAVFTSALLHID